MFEPHQTPPLPLTSQPLVTFALFAYNQEKYIREALEGALAQTYQPLEIIFSDDGSSDQTFKIMQEVVGAYDGPHHVRLNRNPNNLGLTTHVNRVLAMAKGELIVMAAGDDISLPNRVSESVETFVRHPEAMAVSFSDSRIDGTGAQVGGNQSTDTERTIDLATFLAAGPRAQSELGISGASRAFRRRVYEVFGPLHPECPGEDTPFLLRALYLGNLIVIGRPGILYRLHLAQMSSSSGRARQTGCLYQDQFRDDINIASIKKLINPTQLKSASIFARNFRTDRELHRLSFYKNRPDINFAIRFTLSNQYSIREKVGMIKRFFLRKQI